MDNEGILQHIGILGMKWGHRKSSITNNAPSHSNNSEDYNKKVSLKGKKLRQMSNSELKALNERLQLEKQYKDLTKNETNPGKKFVTDLLVNNSKDIASQYIKKYGVKGINALLEKAVKASEK